MLSLIAATVRELESRTPSAPGSGRAQPCQCPGHVFRREQAEAARAAAAVGNNPVAAGEAAAVKSETPFATAFDSVSNFMNATTCGSCETFKSPVAGVDDLKLAQQSCCFRVKTAPQTMVSVCNEPQCRSRFRRFEVPADGVIKKGEGDLYCSAVLEGERQTKCPVVKVAEGCTRERRDYPTERTLVQNEGYLRGRLPGASLGEGERGEDGAFKEGGDEEGGGRGGFCSVLVFILFSPLYSLTFSNFFSLFTFFIRCTSLGRKRRE